MPGYLLTDPHRKDTELELGGPRGGQSKCGERIHTVGGRSANSKSEIRNLLPKLELVKVGVEPS